MMSLRILLHLAVLSSLSIATLGQTITLPVECTNAVTTFTQSTACFGSQTGINGFIALSNSTSTDFSRNPALNDPTTRQAVTIFYNNFCASQDCINSYANAFQPCFDALLRQVSSYIANMYGYQSRLLVTLYLAIQLQPCISRVNLLLANSLRRLFFRETRRYRFWYLQLGEVSLKIGGIDMCRCRLTVPEECHSFMEAKGVYHNHEIPIS